MTEYLKQNFGLCGKCALVTGASRGIGRAVALALAQRGAAVAVHYHRSKKKAEEVVKEIINMGGQSWSVSADLSDSNGSKELIDHVKGKWEHLDILVNNAGDMVNRSSLLQASNNWIETVLRVNLHSTLYVTRDALPLLLKGRLPAVINTASISAHNGGAGGVSVYAAAKGAILSLTRSMARELAPTVRVNAIAPGVILTDLHNRLSTQAGLESLAQQTPLKRNGQPEECASAVIFLSSDASSFITGQVIEINGGLWMG